MPKAWKIAPGEKARAWPECRDGGCILMGWQPLGDYRKYETKDHVLRALKTKCGDWKTGKGRRAADSIWSFAWQVQEGDIVVANEGRGKVVGVGRVGSDYLSARDRGNPSQHESLKIGHRRAANGIPRHKIKAESALKKQGPGAGKRCVRRMWTRLQQVS
jgi:Uncharacterized conserved protein